MEHEVNYSLCAECIEDEYLERIINEKGDISKCSQCGKNNNVIYCEDLAQLLEGAIRENFTKGTLQTYFKRDGNSYEYLNGVTLQEVIDDILGVDVAFGDKLVELLMEREIYDPSEGEDFFFADDEHYVQIVTDNLNLKDEWYKIIDELKTKRRFFSDNARNFFNFLLEDLDKLWTSIDVVVQKDSNFIRREKRTVLQNLPVNTKIYRARRASSFTECEGYLLNPIQELAPPPTEYAQQGRMNAKGISNFYGAFDIDTCIAEMRPSIGSYIVVGEFKTTRELKILNFEYLENSYRHISYFLYDYQDQSAKRKFLKKIHKLISTPIINGHEDEYLITQVLSEYLAFMHPANIDGISFKSTQSEKGSNIVLFPKKTKVVERYSFNDENDLFDIDKISIEDKNPEIKDELDKFNVAYIQQSASLHQTQKVAYTSIEKVFNYTTYSGKMGIAFLEDQTGEEY